MDFTDLFASALAPFYANACLHRATRTNTGDGSHSLAFADTPCKAMVDPSANAPDTGGGMVTSTVQIMVLRAGVSPPDTDDEITVDCARYKIAAIATDPLRAGYVLRCIPAS